VDPTPTVTTLVPPTALDHGTRRKLVFRYALAIGAEAVVILPALTAAMAAQVHALLAPIRQGAADVVLGQRPSPRPARRILGALRRAVSAIALPDL
jgi:hypothetical protein